MKESGRTVSLMWVPSHCGIKNNEDVDKAARMIANSNEYEDVPLHLGDLKNFDKTKEISDWQTLWKETNAKLRCLKPSVNKRISPLKLTRKEQVVLTRLRIGHTKITHLYLLLGEQQPLCITCQTKLTVQHILVECPKYEETRRQHNITGAMNEILCDDRRTLSNMMTFLKATNIIDEI
ncbi:uncharacterized protein [Leptinotarsa decemlineata]|uniref:uncharacterized protein n=1 Tax=Leptinotarsa decemlineata TaxID=7539 RepID=UPI003D304169